MPRIICPLCGSVLSVLDQHLQSEQVCCPQCQRPFDPRQLQTLDDSAPLENRRDQPAGHSELALLLLSLFSFLAALVSFVAPIGFDVQLALGLFFAIIAVISGGIVLAPSLQREWNTRPRCPQCGEQSVFWRHERSDGERDLRYRNNHRYCANCQWIDRHH